MILGNINFPVPHSFLFKNQVFEIAFETLFDLSINTPKGVTQLNGDLLYLNVHSYDTKKIEFCRFESHRRYIDLQYIISGGEYIDWAIRDELTNDGKYDEENDFQFYKAPAVEPITRIHLTNGSFAIFFPDDAHRPQISDSVSSGVYKAVIKIHKSLLNF